MRQIDVLDDLVVRGKAMNAAAKARAARVNEVSFVEVNEEPAELLGGEIETYDQLVACIVRILGLAAPIAAGAINPKKVATEDAGNWARGRDNKASGRDGWEIFERFDQRLWLYRSEGRLVQQFRYPGVERMIREATYQPSGHMANQAWEVRPEDTRIEVGPFDVSDSAMPFVRYCGALAAAKAFFAFCDRANVIDIVNEGVAQILVPEGPTDAI